MHASVSEPIKLLIQSIFFNRKKINHNAIGRDRTFGLIFSRSETVRTGVDREFFILKYSERPIAFNRDVINFFPIEKIN